MEHVEFWHEPPVYRVTWVPSGYGVTEVVLYPPEPTPVFDRLVAECRSCRHERGEHYEGTCEATVRRGPDLWWDEFCRCDGYEPWLSAALR